MEPRILAVVHASTIPGLREGYHAGHTVLVISCGAYEGAARSPYVLAHWGRRNSLFTNAENPVRPILCRGEARNPAKEFGGSEPNRLILGAFGFYDHHAQALWPSICHLVLPWMLK